MPRLRRVRLPALTDDECDAVVASMLIVDDAAKRRAQSAQIHAVTGGNPFHVVETVAALVDAGRIVPTARGTWEVVNTDARGVVLPGTVREALERRISLLDDEARLALRIIARARGSVDAATSGLSPHGIDQLVARRFVRNVDGRLELAHETIRAVALAGEQDVALGASRSRWRRSAIVAAAMAAIALVVAAGMNYLRRRAEARDIVPDRVAVFPFAVNAPAELQYLDEGMVDLLAGSLDGAGRLRVVDPKALLGHLEREARARGRRHLTTDEAATIARRFGAGLFVLGSVAGTRDTFEVTATLYGARGERLGASRAAGAGEAKLFEMLGQLTRELIASRYAESSEKVLATAALTTTSIPALKAFLIGSQQVRAGHFGEAATSLQRAVASDSLFALAWYRLSLAASGIPNSSLFDLAVTRARMLRDRLPQQERLLLEGSFMQHTGRIEDSERALNGALALNPFLIDTWERLAELRFHNGPVMGRYIGEAREPFERLLALDPENENAIVHLARIAAYERRSAALDSLVDRGMTIPGAATRPLELRALRAFAGSNAEEQQAVLDAFSPGAVQEIWDIGWRVVTFTENLDGFEQFAVRLLRDAPDDAWRAAGHVMRAHAFAAGGRFAEADRATDSVLALVPHWGHLMRAAITLSWPIPPRVETLVKSLESWDASKAPKAEPGPNTFAVAPPTDFAMLFRAAYIAQGAARRHDSARFGHSMRAMAAAEPPGKVYPHVHTMLTYARVRQAAEAGDFREAIASDTGPAYRKRQPLSAFGATPLFSLAATRELRGDIHAAVGERQEALAWYRSEVEDLGFALIHHPAMHLRLGDTFTAIGQPDSARVHYARFRELWRKADSGVAARVRIP